MPQVKTAVEYAIAERDALKSERDALIVERNRARIERDVAVTRAQRHDFLQRQVRDLKDMLESAREAERVWEGPFLKKIAELDDELIALKSERDELKKERDWLRREFQQLRQNKILNDAGIDAGPLIHKDYQDS